MVRRQTAAKLPSAQRSGRVFDSMGFLLVGAEVVPAVGASQKTGADGTFAIDLLKHQTNDLLVRADGRRGEWLRTSAISPDPLVAFLVKSAPWDDQPTPPPAIAQLRGEGVVQGSDGHGLANAFVNVLGTDCWGISDETGRVELPLPSASATFVVHYPSSDTAVGGLAAVSAPFVSPRARGIVPLPALACEPAGSISGTVRNARGEAIAGLPVAVRGPGGRRLIETGAGGQFVMSGLVPAEYMVEPFPYRGAIGQAMSVQVDRAVVSCDLHLAKVEEVSLRVIDEQGAAAVGVWVATSLHGLRRDVDQTGVDGFVSLPINAASEFDVRMANSFASYIVREYDAEAQPPTLVIAQP